MSRRSMNREPGLVAAREGSDTWLSPDIILPRVDCASVVYFRCVRHPVAQLDRLGGERSRSLFRAFGGFFDPAPSVFVISPMLVGDPDEWQSQDPGPLSNLLARDTGRSPQHSR